MKKRIAVPCTEEGKLDAHFGHCKKFNVFTVDDKNIILEEAFNPPPHEPGVLPKWLAGHGVTDVIAGGMGNKAIQIFNSIGVNVFVGAPQKTAKELVQGFLNNTIDFNANYCNH